MSKTEGLFFSTADVAICWQEYISYPPQTLQIVNGPWRVEKILQFYSTCLLETILSLKFILSAAQKDANKIKLTRKELIYDLMEKTHPFYSTQKNAKKFLLWMPR